MNDIPKVSNRPCEVFQKMQKFTKVKVVVWDNYMDQNDETDKKGATLVVLGYFNEIVSEKGTPTYVRLCMVEDKHVPSPNFYLLADMIISVERLRVE